MFGTNSSPLFFIFNSLFVISNFPLGGLRGLQTLLNTRKPHNKAGLLLSKQSIKTKVFVC
jgi:hypothetical protein